MSLAGPFLMACGLSQWVGRSFAAVAPGLELVAAVLLLLRREELAADSGPGKAALVTAAVLALASIKAPGVGPAAAILALGHANGDRVPAGLGIAALVGYLSHHYHALHATLLEKSELMGCTGLAVLAGVNGTIARREQLIREGAVARLELAPVDPARSCRATTWPCASNWPTTHGGSAATARPTTGASS